MILAWLALTLSCAAADPVQPTEKPQTMLYVQTVPSGAEVQRDGKTLGRSNELFPVEPGPCKIVLKLDGFQTEEKSITVAEGRVTRLEVTFKATAASPVVEGVGWGAFRVGATREEIAKVAGPPDETLPGDNQMQVADWKSSHIQCLFGPQGDAFEIRFNQGFPGALASGIKIGSSEKEVLAAYETPDRVVRSGEAKKLEYGERGVLMWFVKGKVANFKIFKPYKTNGTAFTGESSEPQVISDADNLLKNASCEEGDQTPVGWRQGAKIPGVRYLWDRSTAFQGKASLCLEKTAQRYFPIAQWFQVIEYSGDQSTLVVSAQVKAQKMTKAVLDVVFLDEKEQGISHEWAAYIGAKEPNDPPADHDWKLYSGKVTIPPKTKKILIGLQDYGPGKVWFDDIRAAYAK